MAEPALVRDSVKAMRDVLGSDLAVTVKHRIGIDRIESYEFVRDFVGTVAEGGCDVFIVHARNAWLQGLSPKENREVPPLRHELVHTLKREFPQLTVVINGGITTGAQITEQLARVDGVMVGREAYHHPCLMADWDASFWGDGMAPEVNDDWRMDLEQRMMVYIECMQALQGTPWPHITRHLLGLWNGQPGARRWRQVWSNHRLKSLPARDVARLAHAARLGHAAAEEPMARGPITVEAALS
jgi:tRNA-dihydrouridine synthase A